MDLTRVAEDPGALGPGGDARSNDKPCASATQCAGPETFLLARAVPERPGRPPGPLWRQVWERGATGAVGALHRRD